MALGVVGVERHRRVLRRGDRPLDGQRAVGELVLDRLERPDRHVELDALLGVRQRHVEHSACRADHLGRERRGGALDRRGRRASVSTGGSPSPVRSTSNMRREKSIVPTGRRSRVTRCDDPTVGPASTTTIQSTRSASGTNVFTGSAFGDPDPVGAGERDRCGRFACEHRAEAVVAGCGEERSDQRDRREEGARCRDVPELLAEHEQVAARAVAEGGELAQMRRRARQLPPGRRCAPATSGRRALVGEQRRVPCPAAAPARR